MAIKDKSHFQFKQFQVIQPETGLKITTESCVLGAWVPIAAKVQQILDIGTGTGLLSLMMAQRCDASIDAVEIDHKMADLANTNFSKSPWTQRLNLIQEDIINYHSEKKYDLIVVNPPFFAHHLKGKQQQKNQALHEDLLDQQTLLTSISRLLADNGRFAVMYPPFQADQFQLLCQSLGFEVLYTLILRDKADKPALRMIRLFGREQPLKMEETLIIKTSNGDYHPDFTTLLKPFYLRM